MSDWRIRARAPRGRIRDLAIERDPEVLASFREDAAHFPGGYAAGVVTASSEADIAQTLETAACVLPIGAQSSLTGGATPHGEVIISTARLNIAREDSVQGAPDLVIEILSPRTARRDRTIKLQLYRRQSVAEYWIVDMDVKQIEVWRLAHGATEAERYTDSVPVRLGRQTIGSIELAKVFDWPP